MTDDELRGWEASDSDIGDDLHVHFGKWGRWDWCDTAEEARRVYNVMFKESVEDGSAIDAVISAAVAHADGMAYEAMAAALGLNASALRVTVAEWAEKQDSPPPPVSAARLVEMVAETQESFRSYASKH